MRKLMCDKISVKQLTRYDRELDAFASQSPLQTQRVMENIQKLYSQMFCV